jgi:hypothetical protein
MRKILIGIIFIIGVFNLTTAQEPNSRESLRGLSAIPVHVLMVERQGYLRERIQEFVELRLRLAGIKVPSNNASMREEGDAALYITLFTEGSLMIDVKLKQYVFLARRPSIRTYEQTWSSGTFDPNIENASEDVAKGQIGKMLDSFINSYLAVNPKK